MLTNPRALIQKILEILALQILALPAERIAEIEDFIEFIAAREQQREQERGLTRAAAASLPAFAAIWNNPVPKVCTLAL